MKRDKYRFDYLLYAMTCVVVDLVGSTVIYELRKKKEISCRQ